MSIFMNVCDPNGQKVESVTGLDVPARGYDFYIRALAELQGTVQRPHDAYVAGWEQPDPKENAIDFFNWWQTYWRLGIIEHSSECDCLRCQNRVLFGSREAQLFLQQLEDEAMSPDKIAGAVDTAYDERLRKEIPYDESLAVSVFNQIHNYLWEMMRGLAQEPNAHLETY